MNRTSRLFKLMDALRGHRRSVTAASLAQELGVSVRTIYRDVQTLVELGAPIEGEAGIGFVLRPGYFLPPLMFDEDELEALVLGARWVRQQGDAALGRAASSALAKIATASPRDLRDRMADTGLWAPAFASRPDQGVAVSLMRESIRRERKVGTPVELVTVDLARGEQRRPQFLRMNPNGRVPVLEDGGFYLTESHAIMQYLADKTPGQTVYPADVRARADVNRWMFWSAQHMQPAVSILVYERYVKGLLGRGSPDPAEERRGEALVGQYLGLLDTHLDGRSWISGRAMTLADLAIAATLDQAEYARLSLEGYRDVTAWLARVLKLEAWRKLAA